MCYLLMKRSLSSGTSNYLLMLSAQNTFFLQKYYSLKKIA